MAEYDPLVTMAALNMAIVSLHKITSTGDRVILDREYTGIINNLSMGEINADPELVSLYKEIMRVIRQGRLRDEDRAVIDSEYSQQKQKGIKEIVSGNLGKTFSTSPVKWLGRLAAACVSEYFRSRARAEVRREGGQFKLRKEEIAEYDELQQKLVDAWKLLRQYRLQDKYVLTQTALDRFYDAVQEDDSSKRMIKLKYLDRDFEVYSPYWFYRAKAAQDSGDIEEARKCFGKFWEVWRPVLRRDPYKVEALKFRIGELMQENISGKNKQEILKCLDDMKDNTELEDWANNIYMGMIYFALGMKEEAEERVKCNIVFGYETDSSTVLLDKINGKETLPQPKPPVAEPAKPKLPTSEPTKPKLPIAEPPKPKIEPDSKKEPPEEREHNPAEESPIEESMRLFGKDVFLEDAKDYERKTKFIRFISSCNMEGFTWLAISLFAVFGYSYMSITDFLAYLAALSVGNVFLWIFLGWLRKSLFEKTVRSYNLSAQEGNNAEAQYRLGVLYEHNIDYVAVFSGLVLVIICAIGCMLIQFFMMSFFAWLKYSLVLLCKFVLIFLSMVAFILYIDNRNDNNNKKRTMWSWYLKASDNGHTGSKSRLKAAENDTDSQYDLGLAYKAAGKLQDAQRCFTEAVKHGNKLAQDQIRTLSNNENDKGGTNH